MEKSLTVYYTSDIHGNFLPKAGSSKSLANCMAAFDKGDDCLVMDGGDLLFSSPLTSFMFSKGQDAPAACGELMNLGGYDYITLGNHDFDYGMEVLESFLQTFKGECLCANVHGLPLVQPWTVHTAANGLRIGITGAITPFVTKLMPKACLDKVKVTEVLPALREAYAALQAQKVDMSVCIYHGGFERDLADGRLLSTTGENQGYAIAQEIGFDTIFCAHQHTAVECAYIGATHVCELTEEGDRLLRITLTKKENIVSVDSAFLPSAKEPLPSVISVLQPYAERARDYLLSPIGYFTEDIQPIALLTMALEGTPLVNFINQAQLYFSGGDISAASLPNRADGLGQEVNREQLLRFYPFANTLKLIEVDRPVLKAALERCAGYFTLDDQGQPAIHPAFLTPVEQHFNFDYFYGLQVVIDIKAPLGSRVRSIRYQGEELIEGRKLRLALNSFRATGAGGYEAYRDCPLLWESTMEVTAMLQEYLVNNSPIKPDTTHYLQIKA